MDILIAHYSYFYHHPYTTVRRTTRKLFKQYFLSIFSLIKCLECHEQFYCIRNTKSNAWNAFAITNKPIKILALQKRKPHSNTSNTIWNIQYIFERNPPLHTRAGFNKHKPKYIKKNQFQREARLCARPNAHFVPAKTTPKSLKFSHTHRAPSSP